ncbi:hypothetical protein WMY93_030700 [Mugilogobius chulae]|uniref:Uncharacterized protein n=1 Tax=Mugilogobius chulae TaxID=88201 RepID=A0AAW0MQH1_9GOBI
MASPKIEQEQLLWDGWHRTDFKAGNISYGPLPVETAAAPLLNWLKIKRSHFSLFHNRLRTSYTETTWMVKREPMVAVKGQMPCM